MPRALSIEEKMLSRAAHVNTLRRQSSWRPAFRLAGVRLSPPVLTAKNPRAGSIEPFPEWARPMGDNSGAFFVNHSLFTADRATHLKIVGVSLVAAIVVMAVLAARPAVTTQLQTGGSVVKPSKAVTWINQDPAGHL
jgi:hypothetical protein